MTGLLKLNQKANFFKDALSQGSHYTFGSLLSKHFCRVQGQITARKRGGEGEEKEGNAYRLLKTAHFAFHA